LDILYKFGEMSTLPEATTVRLLGDTNLIARRMTRRIAQGNELPPQFRSIGNLRAVTKACREALDTLVRLLHEGRGFRPGDLDRLGAMGAREAENGLPLEVLLGAYRIAARVLWEDVISESVQRNELAPDTVVTATSYVLEYFDLISGAVGRAYLETRERIVLQRDRERERVLQRLLAGDVSTEMQHLAAAVDLQLTPPYTVIACDFDPAAEATRVPAWADALQVPVSLGRTVVLLPESSELPQMEKTDHLGRFAVGPPAATLADISVSARAAQELLDVGSVLDPARRILDFGDYAPFVTLRRDVPSTRAYVARILGAVDRLSPKRQADSLETIEAIVETSTLADAAERLGVHRHTLMYRLEKLAEIGIDVQDPAHRNRLWLALRLRKLTA
jgi:hypothetical protein